MLKRDEQGNLVESYEGREGLLQNIGTRTDADDMLASRYEERNKKYLDRVRNMSPVLESESGEHPLESEQYSFPNASPQPNGNDERLKRLEIPDDKSKILPKTDQEWFWAKIEHEDAAGLGEYDQWTEQYLDSTGAFVAKTGGRDETTTAMSLWEANYTEGIPVDTYVKVWVEKESDGDIIYLFTVGGAVGTHVSPAAILPATYEGTETAQTDTWDVTSQGAYDGLAAKVTTRVVYNEAGDKALYGFYRTFTYNSVGMLVLISAETKYTIDTADSCT